METCDNSQGDDDVRNLSEWLTQMLNPAEAIIMRIQSLLVWERPNKSLVLLLCVHGIFWFFAFIGCKFYFMISATAIIIYFTHTWKHKIWPEIRVPPPFPDDPDSWTPVHPRLLSVPELCQYLAQMWSSLVKWVLRCLLLRRQHPFLFCVLSSSCFLFLAVIGTYISGFMLTYILVISMMLWPCVLYHNLLQKLYLRCEPVFMRMDYSLKLRGKWAIRGNTSGPDGSLKEGKEQTDSDSDAEFNLDPDPEVTAALARAITDSEDESGSSLPLSTPRLSKEPSVELFEDGNRSLEPELEFAPGVHEMPSFDDVLDHTDDDLDFDDRKLVVPSNKETDSINFVQEHFGDTSDSEDENLTRGLDFGKHPINTEGDKIAEAETRLSSAASNLVTLVGGALSGLTALSAMAMQKESSTSKAVVYQSEDSVDFIDAGDNSVNPETCDDDIADIDDEFEFLDQYEAEEEGAS